MWLLSPPQGRSLKNRNQIYSCVYLEGQLGYFVYSKPTAVTVCVRTELLGKAQLLSSPSLELGKALEKRDTRGDS